MAVTQTAAELAGILPLRHNAGVKQGAPFDTFVHIPAAERNQVTITWPIAVAPEMRPVLERLMALGMQWALRRDSNWTTVLNDGPVPTRGPLYRFRWSIVTDALRFATGQTTDPPRDYFALPTGLREFLAWAVPIAIVPPSVVPTDLERSRQAMNAATRWAAELVPDPMSESPTIVRRQEPSTTAGETDPGAMLRQALAPAPSPALPPAAIALVAELCKGPLPLSAVRTLAAADGLLVGTLLDCLDAAAVRRTGEPATRVEDATVYLAASYQAALTRGEDPLA